MSNSTDWFSRKMGASAPQPQQQPVYQQPVQQQAPAPQMPQAQPQAQPQASVSASRCPGCGSGNYGSSPMAPESRARCYDCGYPLQQSGSGMGTGITSGPAASGPAIPAKQVQAGGWNPQTIIGHI